MIDELIKRLRNVAEKESKKVHSTCDLRVDLMATDAADALESLQRENAELQNAYNELFVQFNILCDENRWIPVAEQLPESGVHVLISCEIKPSGSKYVCDGYYAAAKTIVCEDNGDCACEYDDKKDEYFLLEGYYEVIKNWDDFSSIVIDDFVTHWRPLPAVPEQEATHE